MAIKKINSQKWKVDLQPGGRRGKRIRKTFTTQAEAKRFESFILGKAAVGEWNPQPKDKRLLTELVELWYLHHGSELKDGERRYHKLLVLADELNNPPVAALTPVHWLDYRKKRLKQGIAKKTLNNELGYLRACFNRLIKIGELRTGDPLSQVDAMAIDERELSWLNQEQIQILFQELEKAINPHVYLIAAICINTGARWSEAESLAPEQVYECKVRYINTKSGKSRTVPISESLQARIDDHFTQHGLFTNSISAFRRAMNRADISLPAGQCSHVLRHTYASNFIMKGGNIVTLQRILGHSDIRMTMRYSHLAPDYLAEAVQLAPLEFF